MSAFEHSHPRRYRIQEATGASQRVVIRALKVKPVVSTDFEDSIWKKLKNALHCIYIDQSFEYSWEELYRDVEALCRFGTPATSRLHSRLMAEMEHHCSLEHDRLSAYVSSHCNSGGSLNFLQVVNDCWLSHCHHTSLIRNLFLYLNQSYTGEVAVSDSDYTRVPSSGFIGPFSTTSIWSNGLTLFRRVILERSSSIVGTITASLLNEIDKDRECTFSRLSVMHSMESGPSSALSLSLIRSVLDMLVATGMYGDVFHRPLEVSTERFYGLRADSLIKSLPIDQYLVFVDRTLQDEKSRCMRCFRSSSSPSIIRVCEQVLIERHAEVLISDGAPRIFQSPDVAWNGAIARMYNFLRLVNRTSQLCHMFGEWIKKSGHQIVCCRVEDLASRKSSAVASCATEVVHALFALRKTCETLLVNAFDNNKAFQDIMRDSFEHVMNIDNPALPPAEALAKYLDWLMKSKVPSTEELDAAFDSALVLFRAIQGKDVFEAFYKKDFAKRLLLGRSSSFDGEKAMITKLKAECGASFTLKIEGMFKDIELSRDVMRAFVDYRKTASETFDIDLNVTVLTRGNWPTYSRVVFSLPTSLSNAESGFKNFYVSTYSGRKLSFIHSLGQCVVHADFARGAKDLVVSLPQAIVLLIFNGTDVEGHATADKQQKQLTYSEIATATEIPHTELRRVLQSLACFNKLRLLHKSPKGRNIGENDVFSVNNDFVHSLCKIRVNSVQVRESEQERETVSSKVVVNRQFAIDAAIVRVMKTRKTMSHNELISALGLILRFPIDAAAIKKQIEALIERDYLERDDSDSSIYKYCA